MPQKKLKTKVVVKSESRDKEYLIINPPYSGYSNITLPKSNSLIIEVGNLRKMLTGLKAKDAFRIEWFADGRTAEYSFIKDGDKV